MTASPIEPDASRFTVNPALTGNTSGNAARARRRRRRTDVENDTFMAFASRIIRAAGKRIASGDVETLPDLAALQVEVDQALSVAVQGLREFGYSWGEIASRLGVTRQAAQQRWAPKPSDGSESGVPGQGDLW